MRDVWITVTGAWLSLFEEILLNLGSLGWEKGVLNAVTDARLLVSEVVSGGWANGKRSGMIWKRKCLSLPCC